MVHLKTKKEIEILREAGYLLFSVMKEIKEMIKPGVATDYLDLTAESLILKMGAKPNFKGYRNFPATICACINEEIVHCAPSKEKKIKEGDIVSIDAGLLFKGFNADMAFTVPVGEVSFEARRLIRVTKKALKRGIKKARPGNTFGDIGNTIQRYVESQGFNVVRELCGHGIGRALHEEPDVLNYGKRGEGIKLKEGMVFCLEPMVTAGDWHIKRTEDGYGYKTKDNSLSAHFEAMIAITKDGCEVLTPLL